MMYCSKSIKTLDQKKTQLNLFIEHLKLLTKENTAFYKHCRNDFL